MSSSPPPDGGRHEGAPSDEVPAEPTQPVPPGPGARRASVVVFLAFLAAGVACLGAALEDEASRHHLAFLWGRKPSTLVLLATTHVVRDHGWTARTAGVGALWWGAFGVVLASWFVARRGGGGRVAGTILVIACGLEFVLASGAFSDAAEYTDVFDVSWAPRSPGERWFRLAASALGLAAALAGVVGALVAPGVSESRDRFTAPVGLRRWSWVPLVVETAFAAIVAGVGAVLAFQGSSNDSVHQVDAAVATATALAGALGARELERATRSRRPALSWVGLGLATALAVTVARIWANTLLEHGPLAYGKFLDALGDLRALVNGSGRLVGLLFPALWLARRAPRPARVVLVAGALAATWIEVFPTDATSSIALALAGGLLGALGFTEAERVARRAAVVLQRSR